MSLGLSADELNQVFDILESYIVRRLLHRRVEEKDVCKKINDFFVKLLSFSTSDSETRAKEIKKFRVEEFANFLSNGDRYWTTDVQVLHSLREVGYQIRFSGRSVGRLVQNMLGYILYRIECRKIERWNQENPSNAAKKITFDFKDFLRQREENEQESDIQADLSLSVQLLRPLSKRDKPTDSYSMGNLTFCAEHLTKNLSFPEIKRILSETPNANIMLNQEICNKYNTWGVAQIKEREKDLLDCFHEIWPPAEHFTGQASKPKVEPTTETTVDQAPKSKAEPRVQPRWVSMIQSGEYQFVTYAGNEKLSGIKTRDDKVIGVDRYGNEQTLAKPNILFACSATAWPEVEPYIEILDYVRREKLNPPQYQERLSLADKLLKTVQNEQATVLPVTRYGHVLEGTIEGFDEDAIYMQIREDTVIVYRRGIYEFATGEWDHGQVTEFDENRGFGYIRSSKHPRIFAHIQNVLDKNMRVLQLGQKVEFEINRTTKGLSAIDVELVKE